MYILFKKLMGAKGKPKKSIIFSIKKPKTDFDKKTYQIFWTNRAMFFLANIATNLLKKYDFANRQHNSTGS